MNKELINRELQEAGKYLRQFIIDENNINNIEMAASLMITALKSGNKIISCGNGGSMCDAMHFAEELSGRFRNNRKALAAVSISDPSHLTCVGNDYGFDYVFSRYIEALGKKGDVLLAISTSGSSPNIINAAITAKDKEITIVALTGKNGGRLAQLSDVEVRAPFSEYSDRTQEIHIKVIHTIISLIKYELSDG